MKHDEIFRTPGRYGWTGGLGTSAYNDPSEGMIGIFLTQRLMDSPVPPKVFTDFWTLAYAAMEQAVAAVRILPRGAEMHSTPTPRSPGHRRDTNVHKR